MFKVNNRNTKQICEICSTVTIKTSDVFTVDFEHISHLVLVLTIVDFEQVIAGWVSPEF